MFYEMKNTKKIVQMVFAIILSIFMLLPYNVAAAENIDISEKQQMLNQAEMQTDSGDNLQEIVTSDSNEYKDTANLISSVTNVSSGFNDKTLFKVRAAASQTVGEIAWRISNEYVNGKSRFTYHIDKLTGVRPVYIAVLLTVTRRDGLADTPKTYGNKMITFDANEITEGASKSIDVDAKTGYMYLYGTSGYLSPDGTPSYGQILTPTILVNNKNQYFPNYIDPVSKKQAVDGVRTDWAKTGSRPWNGRKSYIKQFETNYGTQAESYWNAVQIHHIRPRNFGGEDTFDNLMPVETSSHRLITS